MAAQYDTSFFSGDISYTDTHRILRIHTANIYRAIHKVNHRIENTVILHSYRPDQWIPLFHIHTGKGTVYGWAVGSDDYLQHSYMGGRRVSIYICIYAPNIAHINSWQVYLMLIRWLSGAVYWDSGCLF